jgi:ABC-type lipoprotein release transport system permease subunit
MGLAKLVTAHMFGVKPADPLTLVVAGMTLTVVAIVAACFPAMRAARVDPIVALRVE